MVIAKSLVFLCSKPPQILIKIMPNFIYTDLHLLNRIKKMQYKSQLPALALLVLSFLISFFFASFNMRYPSLFLSIISLVWFMFISACFRQRQKLPVPEEGKLLCPLTGRVRSLKRSSDLYQLKISKSFLDVVEIRCPHESAVWDGDLLRVVYQDTPLVFRFETEKLVRFPEQEMQPGNVIGMISGSAICSLSLSQSMMTTLKPGDICEGGQTTIF